MAGGREGGREAEDLFTANFSHIRGPLADSFYGGRGGSFRIIRQQGLGGSALRSDQRDGSEGHWQNIFQAKHGRKRRKLTYPIAEESVTILSLCPCFTKKCFVSVPAPDVVV